MAIRQLYGLMRTVENQLGGGEGVEGIYGSLTQSGMARVIESMHTRAGLTARSSLLDIGSGLGRPLAHAAVHPGVRRGMGIEMDPVKHAKAQTFKQRVADGMRAAGFARQADNLDTLQMINCAVEDHVGLDCTHAYAFWEGFSTDSKRAVGELFSKTASLRFITVAQRAMRDPVGEMEQLGFPRMELLDSMPVTMSGSGRAFRAYVFKKAV